MGKYQRLESYLTRAPACVDAVTLGFGQIEQIIDASLPPSALTHGAWWSNEVLGSHVQARSWMDAGWVVLCFNLKEKWVGFGRKK